MPKGGKSTLQKKKDYFSKLSSLLDEHHQAFIVNADNVGSEQLQQVRRELRGRGVLVMGKNTIIRKCIRDKLNGNGYPMQFRGLASLLPHVKGNVGFVFAKQDDLVDLRARISAITVEAPAKIGAVAPCDIVVPRGQTYQDPAKTSFFQALNIPTRISRGFVEMVVDVVLVRAGTKLTASQVTLLQMLNLKPFTYALSVVSVYDDGNIYPPALLDLTDDVVLCRFRQGVANVAALSMRIGLPTAASVPHVLANGFRDLLAVSVATDYTFAQAKPLKQLLADPEALQALLTPPQPPQPVHRRCHSCECREQDDLSFTDLFGDEELAVHPANLFDDGY
jgi:large subunit ribosomal protein LP0